MADTPPAKRKRGRPRKTPDPASLPLEEAAEAAAAEALKKAEPAPGGDTAPGAEPGAGSAPRKRNRVTKKGTQQIEDGLREILQMPAVPASIFGDQWAADHFTQQGAAFANRIAVVSERNPVLRGWCEKALAGESLAVLLMAGVLYAGPAALHFGLIPGGELMGIPVMRRKQSAPEPVPAQATAPTDAAFGHDAPQAQPYGGEPVEFSNGDGPPVWEPAP